MSLPYYPMYPRDFYEGTQQMSLELKGAYIMVLNLIYTRDGPVSDEPGYLARYVGCSIRKWQKLRLELIGLGKLVCENGMICNSRADQELLKRASYRDQQSENRSRPNKIKDEESPPIRTHAKPEPETDLEIEVVVVAGAGADEPQPDIEALQAKCRKWANGSLNLTQPAAHDLSPIIRLMSPDGGGVRCIEADVEAGIKKAAASLHQRGEQVATFAYFEKPIIRERDARLKPLPAPETPNERTGTRGGFGPRTGNRSVLAEAQAFVAERESRSYHDGGSGDAGWPEGGGDGVVERRYRA